MLWVAWLHARIIKHTHGRTQSTMHVGVRCLQDPAASGDDASISKGTLALRLEAALIALLPSKESKKQTAANTASANGSSSSTSPAGSSLDASTLAALFMAAAHSALVAPMRSAPPAWTQVCKRLPGLAAALTAPGVGKAVCEILSGPAGLCSELALERDAACGGLGLAMSIAPHAVYRHVQAVLASLLHRSEHDALGEHDKDVWETPEGTLSSERIPAGVYVPEVIVKKNVKKPRGRFRMASRAFADDDDDDEEEEVVVKKPAPGPALRAVPHPSGPKPAPGKKDAAVREQEFRARKLAEESEVRQRKSWSLFKV